ncbi:MAG: aldo/keto reductase [Microbacteriaceae bacterium]|nr:aldo/keto reductase [Microbacteriaceae bacterium]
MDVVPRLETDRRPLGRGGLAVGRLALGAAPLGNLGTAVSDEDAASTIAAAWERGIRYFDVAPHYGVGLAERRLGKALTSYPRDDYIVSTKVGRILEPDPIGVHADSEGFDVRTTLKRRRDYSRDGALRSLDDSMERLGLDRIDLAFVHDPDDYLDEALDGAFPALEELRSAGVISSYGAGSNHAAPLVRVVRETDSDVILAAPSYTLADQSAQEVLLPLAMQREVSVIAAGVLSPGVIDRRTWSSAQSLSDQRLLVIETFCRERGVPFTAAALQFPFHHQAVTGICVGMRSVAEVVQDLGYFTHEIDEAFWRDLHRLTGLPLEI